MILPYCATCSTPRLKQSPTTIIPFETPLPVLYLILNLTLSLTLLQLPALRLRNSVVLPRCRSTNKSANTDFQLTPNRQEAPSTTVHNLTSRFCKVDILFANELSTYTSITTGMHPNTFSYTIKIARLNLAVQTLLFEKFPQ